MCTTQAKTLLNPFLAGKKRLLEQDLLKNPFLYPSEIVKKSPILMTAQATA